MGLLRSRWSTAFIAALLGCVVVWPAPARAQMFVELAGGLNYVPTLPSGAIYASGSNVRASIGWKVASNFSWRIDAFTSQFDSKDNSPLPCPSFGCPPSAYINSEHVNGLTASGLVSVDPRGIFYVIGGAGLYDVNNEGLTVTERHFGVSAGAGITVPMGSRLRAVVEARWHGLLGNPPGPTWLVPITVGLRY
jgi:hypothetical protein